MTEWQPIETAPASNERVLVTWGAPHLDAQVAWQVWDAMNSRKIWCTSSHIRLPTPAYWARVAPVPLPPDQRGAESA